jgi:hypothetical protein
VPDIPFLVDRSPVIIIGFHGRTTLLEGRRRENLQERFDRGEEKDLEDQHRHIIDMGRDSHPPSGPFMQNRIYNDACKFNIIMLLLGKPNKSDFYFPRGTLMFLKLIKVK